MPVTARYRLSASCHAGMSMPAERSLSLESALNCGRAARIATSRMRTGVSVGSTRSSRASSFANSNQVHDPELTQ